MLVVKCLVLLCLSLTTRAGRILVAVPTPSISHQVVFRPLTEELARRGHEVVVITTDPAFPKGKTPKNLIEIDTHDIAYKTWLEGSASMSTKGSSHDVIGQWNLILGIHADIFKNQILSAEVQSLLNNKTNHFDLVMAEACMKLTTALAHVFKAPLIVISSFGGYPNHYESIGAPSRPVLLYPSLIRQRLFNLSLWEKLTELYNHYLFEYNYQNHVKTYDRLVKDLFGPDTPTMSELDARVDMMFLNYHPVWDFYRPMPHNVVYMGGLHQKPQKDLPEDLKSYFDSSKHGVIYVCFGTNVRPSELPPEKIQVMVKTFSQLPYDVLWKWDKEELPGRSDNIRIFKWLPQSDLLRHPNVKLFITQGGLQSTDEAITAGVPLIGMPMLADQWFNVEHYAHFNIGTRLDLETITEENLKTAIETIVKEDSYRSNVKRLGSIMREQPTSPLQRAVWWTEHVMQHGGAAHLRPHTANMSWWSYLDLPLLATIAASATIALLLVWMLLCCVARSIMRLTTREVKAKTS